MPLKNAVEKLPPCPTMQDRAQLPNSELEEVNYESKLYSTNNNCKCKNQNEVGCRDDTVPKTVETRRHCEECNNLPQPPKSKDVGRGLRKIVACSHSSSQCLLVSTVFGTVSSLHPTSFLMIFTLAPLIFSAISMANTQ